MVEDFLVIAEGEQRLQGRRRRLGRANRWPTKTRFQDAISAASDGSLADVYVDHRRADRCHRRRNRTAGRASSSRAPASTSSEATAVASVIPESDQVEVDAEQRTRAATEPPPDGRRLGAARLAARPTRSPRFAVLRIQRPAQRSDRQPRRRRHPGSGPAEPAEEHAGGKPASTSTRSPARSKKAAIFAAGQQPRQPRRRDGPDQRLQRSGRRPSPTSACCCATPGRPGSPR